MDSNINYSIDDWIVHSYYGVGQIQRVETKPINDEDMECFKVKTKDSTFWFPTTDTKNPRIRPVASQDIMDKVVRLLRSKSNNLDQDKTLWKKRIEDVHTEGDLLSISTLVRDLSAQQVLRDLNQTEKNALEHFKERLLREWASISQEDIERLRSSLHAHIKESQAKVMVQDT
jgi:RNA polymerase-interacting CarD/CdnL/TRCF family regulator